MGSALEFIGGGLLKGAGEGAAKGFLAQMLAEKGRSLEDVRQKNRVKLEDVRQKNRVKLEGEKHKKAGLLQADRMESLKKRNAVTNTKQIQDSKGYYWLWSPTKGLVPMRDKAGTQIKGPLKTTTPKTNASKAEFRAELYKRLALTGHMSPEEIAKTVDAAMTYLYGDKPPKGAAPTSKDEGGWRTWLGEIFGEIFGGTPEPEPGPTSAERARATVSGIPGTPAETSGLSMTPELGRGRGTEAQPFRPSNEDEFKVIESGEFYINPADGETYRKR